MKDLTVSNFLTGLFASTNRVQQTSATIAITITAYITWLFVLPLMKKTLCPFSKPIIGNWCRCQYANLDERCAGKMTCLQAEQYIGGCYELVDLFREKSRFVLGIGQHDGELTHQQLMKIRCGGLLGMQRLLSDTQEPPDVLQMVHLAEQAYGDVKALPFSDIVRDIKEFSHRKSRRK